MNTKQQLEDTISKIPGIRFSYLFGSGIEEQMGPLSDVDVAVYLDSRANQFDNHLMIHHQLVKATKRDVDLVILNKTRNLFLIESILKQGVLITDKTEDFRI